MLDDHGSTCRMIGARGRAFVAQEGRCYRMKNSYVLLFSMCNTYSVIMHTSIKLSCTCTCNFRCFDRWTPRWIYHYSKIMYERKGRKSPFYPLFYGKMRGLFKRQNDTKKLYLSYDVSNTVSPQSLVTLSFVADSVSFVENR